MLARQLLLERRRIGVTRAVEQLAALQAQSSPSPYVALWSRLAGFTRDRLWDAIAKERTVVRARLMRGTLHLVSSRDFYPYAVATQDLQRGAWNRLQIGRGVDPGKVRELAIAFARVPRDKADVLAHLRERVRPAVLGPDGWLVWRFVSAHADLVGAPPGGHWTYVATDAPYVAARHWISGGRRPSEDDAIDHLVMRCVGAFGPVSLADVAKFAGQVPARIRPSLERLAPRLRLFSDERGRILYDLPNGPRPDADSEAPVRFLPRYDEILIAYQHRDRLMDERHRSTVYAKNGIIEAVVLVDGFAAATWALVRLRDEALVRVTPFSRVGARERAAIVDEGTRLAAFLAPDAKSVGAKVS